MREMVKRYGADEDRIVRECAEAEKRGEVPGYLQSQFLLTKSLVEKPRVGMNTQLNRAVQGLLQFDSWNSANIQKRQSMLVQLARDIWQIQNKQESEATVG